MKRILTIIALFGMTVSAAFAQDAFKGHWFIQLQGGAAHTVGETKVMDLISPNGAASVGYQFTPIFGARLNVNGAQAKGAILGPTRVYSFNYVSGNVDVLADICNMFSDYKADRLINPYLVAGLGGSYLFRNCPAVKLAKESPENLSLLWKKANVVPVAKAGMGVDIRLTRSLALNLETNTSFFPDKFNSKRGSKADFQIAGLVGLTYRFGCCGKCAAAPVAPAVEPAPAPEEVVVVEQPVKEEVVEEKPIVDTTPKFEGLTENVFFMIRKWVIRPSEQVKIDKIIEVLKANPSASVKITGHADKETGNAKINQFLSEKRCEIVAQSLEAAGIAKERISTEACGDRNNPYSAPEKNRVAICVVK